MTGTESTHVIIFFIHLCFLAASPPILAFTCDTSSYYEDIQTYLDDPFRTTDPISTLRQHMASHNVIPYTSNTRIDCWDALNVLDADSANASSVVLIYKQTSEPIATQGDSNGWNREHVWPKSYGVGYTGPDTSDLHSLRAADWSVNSARNNRYYDNCEASDGCTVPAHTEAAADTGKKSESGTTGIFMPPANVRGDLARSLFYMAVRYDGSEANTENLQVRFD